jgi:hypothetical protein
VLPGGFHRIRHYGLLANLNVMRLSRLVEALIRWRERAPG